MKVVRLGLCAVALAVAVGLSLTMWTVSGAAQARADNADKVKLAAEAVETFTKYCLDCHGKDPKKLKGDMDILDPKHLARDDRIVAKEPDKSEIIKRIESKEADMVMPPPSKKNPVPAEKVKRLREWIASGGELRPQVAVAQPAPAAKNPHAAAATQILATYCVECHNPKKMSGKLDVLNPEYLAQKERVVPGNPEKSLLVQRVLEKNKDDAMPPPTAKKALPADKAMVLRDWVKAGGELDLNVLKTGAGVSGREVRKAIPLEDEAHSILQARCTNCHGGSNPANGIRLLEDPDGLRDKGIIVPGNPAGSSAIRRIGFDDKDKLRMPPIGQPEMPERERDILKQWIREGAKAAKVVAYDPKSQIGEDYILKVILDDVRKLPKLRMDRYRYFSLNHLLGKGVTPTLLQAHRDALTLILNHLSWEMDPVRPEPVKGDATGTIFRVNIERLGWCETPYRSGPAENAPKARCNLYDLTLLDYPYGVMSLASDTYSDLMNEFMMPGGRPMQVRPIPYVRADWFVNAVGRSPLYEDMLQLPAHIKGLEKRLGSLDAQGNLEKGSVRAIRAGTTVSGVSRNNRVVERHEPQGFAYYWKSHDFRSSKGLENMFKNPIDFTPAGGEMIFSLPNKLQGYYVSDGNGVRLDAAPTDVVTDPFASDKTVRNGFACIRCHESGLRVFRDDVQPALRNARAAVFDLNHALELYPGQEALNQHFVKDSAGFEEGLKALFGDNAPPIRHMLELVSTSFVDQELNVRSASAELGMASPEELRQASRGLRLGSTGLLQLGATPPGVVRRDSWEEYFDQVVRELNLGVPMLPLDGLNRPNYQPPNSDIDYTVSTNRKVYKPKDTLTITVKNKGPTAIYAEIILTGTKGDMVVLTEKVVRIEPGKVYEEGPYVVHAGAGKELVTVFASKKPFECGEMMVMPYAEGKMPYIDGKGMAGRVIHRQFYRMPNDKPKASQPEYDPMQMAKKTIEFATQD